MQMQTTISDVHMMPAASAVERLDVAAPAARQVVAPLQVELFRQMEPLETEWRRLDADNLNSLHQSYDWCAAWVKTHGHPLAILRGSQDGETCFILPMEVVRANMIRVAQFIGARFANINTGLFSEKFRSQGLQPSPQDFVERVTKALQGQADLVSLQNIPLEWRGDKHPFSALPVLEHQNHAFQLPLYPDFERTIAQLNAKRRRKKFRNQQRKLEAVGGYEHIVASTDKEKSALIERFFYQKAVRFKALGLPNVFHPPETQAFFRMLLERDSGGVDVPLQLHALRLKGEHEGKIAAIAGLSRKGDHVICQFGSIDEDLVPEASPGEFLFWLVIEQASLEGAAIFDFGVGDQDYKRRWCTVETVQHDVLLPISGPGRLAAIAQRGVTRTKAVIKGNPQLYALIQRLRAHADEDPTLATGTND